jgi:hypothetical protein
MNGRKFEDFFKSSPVCRPAGMANKLKSFNDFSNQYSLTPMIDYPKSVNYIALRLVSNRKLE